MGNDRPLVGVSQRVVEIAHYDERRDCLDQAWFEWLRAVGCEGIALPNIGAPITELVERLRLDAVVMSGGNNFCGDVYDGIDEAVGDAFESRDTTELALVAHALERGLPLVGFCRGMQTLQVHFGGRLTPTRGSAVTHVAKSHPVQIVAPPFSAWAGDSIEVNSFHDFGVRVEDIAAPLAVFATSADGFAEGVYHPDAPILGAQWHPERKNASREFNRSLLHHALESRRSP